MYLVELFQRMVQVLVKFSNVLQTKNMVTNMVFWCFFPSPFPFLGVTLVSSLVSLFSGYHVPPTTAMTGEISLRGQVLPVGGIKEKVVSAHRAGIRKIIIPYRNRKDVEQDVPEKLREDIEFVFAKNIWDVLESALILKASGKWNTRIYESNL